MGDVAHNCAQFSGARLDFWALLSKLLSEMNENLYNVSLTIGVICICDFWKERDMGNSALQSRTLAGNHSIETLFSGCKI